MSAEINRFAAVLRGKPLPGSRKIAGHVWGDEERWRSAFRLPRGEFGLSVVCGELLGFEGWIDHALAARAAQASGPEAA